MQWRTSIGIWKQGRLIKMSAKEKENLNLKEPNLESFRSLVPNLNRPFLFYLSNVRTFEPIL